MTCHPVSISDTFSCDLVFIMIAQLISTTHAGGPICQFALAIRSNRLFFHPYSDQVVGGREGNRVEYSLQKLETCKWIQSELSVKLDLFRNLVDHNWQLLSQAFRLILPLVREPLLCSSYDVRTCVRCPFSVIVRQN